MPAWLLPSSSDAEVDTNSLFWKSVPHLFRRLYSDFMKCLFERQIALQKLRPYANVRLPPFGLRVIWISR